MTSPRDESPTGTNKASFSCSDPKKILVVFGTRPEAIKLCPLISALRSHASCAGFETLVCVTGQHRQMLDQVLEVFGVTPDYDLNLMQRGQELAEVASRVLGGVALVIKETKPSLVVVQGDTTTTMCGGLAAFYAGVPVAHVEAGLRTFDMQAPFPEEMNRVLTGRLATLHFAATEWAAGNLIARTRSRGSDRSHGEYRASMPS